MTNPRWLAPLLAALFLVAGCNSGGKIQNSTDMRVLHGSLDAGPLDILIDNDIKQGSVAFGTTTGYTNFDSGVHTVAVRVAGTQNTLVTKTIVFASKATQTLVIYGPRASISAELVVDDAVAPASGDFKARVIGLSPDIGPVDVYLTSSDISTVPAAITNASFGTSTDYVELIRDTLPITITPAGTKQILFQSSPQTFGDGDIDTVVIFPSYSGALVNAGLVTTGSNAGGTFLGNAKARFKIANALADSSQLIFQLDGAPLFSGVTYAGVTSYATAASGAHTLVIRDSAVPGSPIASLAMQLDPARDYSLLVVGSLTQAQPVSLTDDNTLPLGGLAKLRFVNANATGGSVDALVDFGDVAAGIAPGTASAYSQTIAGNSHVITFTQPGGVNTIATINNVQFLGGGVYSVYLFGSGQAATIRVTRDR